MITGGESALMSLSRIPVVVKKVGRDIQYWFSKTSYFYFFPSCISGCGCAHLGAGPAEVTGVYPAVAGVPGS